MQIWGLFLALSTQIACLGAVWHANELGSRHLCVNICSYIRIYDQGRIQNRGKKREEKGSNLEFIIRSSYVLDFISWWPRTCIKCVPQRWRMLRKWWGVPSKKKPSHRKPLVFFDRLARVGEEKCLWVFEYFFLWSSTRSGYCKYARGHLWNVFSILHFEFLVCGKNLH